MQQMQPAGPPSPSPSCSSTSDCFPLIKHRSAAECGSETSAEPEKHEVRAEYTWRGGFAWDGSPKQFNWHPVLMVTGLIVLYGNGAVLYRVPLTWGQNKLPWKLLHAAVMLLALVLSVVGLCAVFDFHNAKNTPNLYSLHSWIGIAATALFAMQWVLGLAVFLVPCSPISLRKLLKPVHVWFGGSILSLSIVACISGINEKLFFALKTNTSGTQPYSKLPPEAVLGNTLGVLIVAFGLVVLKILSNPIWQRPDSRPEDTAYTEDVSEPKQSLPCLSVCSTQVSSVMWTARYLKIVHSVQ
ncbi:Cytochrome b ascorbate-dependent protein 3 [Collichthys lucidus]|uniref:Lysosomal membrane ascorbate-dependent ferrireductase CYB561A3 n=1 Tax=Collichthys lucidus TaxID=240159 RepID=A0A4V6APV2_COLLU|nr:Cytochrome b ascorbate-dependent protein 3 [Collichthys lucidus]